MPRPFGDPHALIAGAGVGGLTAALALARRGWRVTMLERRDGADETGAGLQISPNASAILRDLGVLEKLLPTALKPDTIHIRNHHGATLTRLPLKDAEVLWGAPYIDAHRGDLIGCLRAAALAEPNITLHLQTSFTAVTQTKACVTVAALWGSMPLTYEADCLIGADGGRSQVRARMAALCGESDDLPKRANYVAWRAAIPADRVTAALRRPDSSLWLGPHAHLVHYPLRAGRIINVVAVVDARRPLEDAADVWSQAGDAREIAKIFASWAPAAQNLLAAAPEWRVWPLFERATRTRWHEGRVALLGDAAHAMLPFLAQGAAQAIEDAGALATCLADGFDIPAALSLYSEKRHPRAARVQTQSRRQAMIYHLGGPASFVRDLLLRAAGPKKLLAQFDWLYDTRAGNSAHISTRGAEPII